MIDIYHDIILSLIPDWDVFKGFLIASVVWNIFNLIVMNLDLPDKHLKRQDYLDMRNRIVSFFHGTLMVILTGYHFYFI